MPIDDVAFIDRLPVIINGYTAEIQDNYVKFGCARISKDVLRAALNLYELAENTPFTESNRSITDIKIGAGSFDKQDLQDLLS